MISREHPVLPATSSDPAVQFWTKQDDKTNNTSYWLNVATRSPQKEAPVLGKGGIVADGMGLGELRRALLELSNADGFLAGKTLAILSLILATKKDTSTRQAKGRL